MKENKCRDAVKSSGSTGARLKGIDPKAGADLGILRGGGGSGPEFFKGG